MEDEEKIALTAAEGARQKSLELLYDYTKFHIGVYLTLTTAYLAAATAKFGDQPLLHLRPWLFWIAVLTFMVAGLAGGVIVSSITQTPARSSREFLRERIGPWELTWLRRRALTWTWIEHTSFWVGLIIAALSLAFPVVT
ncbi:hypothetical protein PTKU15_92970 [Paraburkholderia terrae]|nr:hypothetical protein PTKU15_92970 [Paraburkholderia terrae]